VANEDGLFDKAVTESPPDLHLQGLTVEARIDKLLELAKSSAQVAAKIRADLDAVVEHAKEGRIAPIGNLMGRVSQGSEQLSQSLTALAGERRCLTVGDDRAIRAYCNELVSALETRGVVVTEGTYPYWLVYPAWFKVEQDAKGEIAVYLNGDLVETIRPSRVAELIAQKVNEDFRAKDFAGLIRRIRDIMRHTGSSVDTMMLDDIFQLITLQPPRRGSRKGDLTNADFYYMVHRLAEQKDLESSIGMSFPPADRPGLQFFSNDGQPRKYLAVIFDGAVQK